MKQGRNRRKTWIRVGGKLALHAGFIYTAGPFWWKVYLVGKVVGKHYRLKKDHRLHATPYLTYLERREGDENRSIPFISCAIPHVSWKIRNKTRVVEEKVASRF